MGISMGSSSGLAEKNSLFRTLTDALSLGSGLAERNSFLRFLADSLAVAPRNAKGSFYLENPHANFNTVVVLAGHYDCRENVITNCGSTTSSFAFLVIASGVLFFSIYAVMQRRLSASHREESEKVEVDTEGWETKVIDKDKSAEANT